MSIRYAPGESADVSEEAPRQGLDSAGLVSLFMRTDCTARSMATRVVGHQNVDDVLQEAKVKVVQRLRNAKRPVRNLVAYYSKTVWNTALSLAGMAKKWRAVQLDQDPSDSSKIPFDADDDRFQDLHDALEELSEREKYVVVTKYFLGWRSRKIAAETSSTADAVRGVLRRALGKLEDYLTRNERRP